MSKLTFQCNYCPAVFPNFKTLVEHYEERHKGKLKRFEIRHKPSKQVALMYASAPEEICQMQGWDINDCKVTVIE